MQFKIYHIRISLKRGQKHVKNVKPVKNPRNPCVKTFKGLIKKR